MHRKCYFYLYILAINLTINIKVSFVGKQSYLKSFHHHSICKLPIHKIAVVYQGHLHLRGAAFVICRDTTYLFLKCE